MWAALNPGNYNRAAFGQTVATSTGTQFRLWLSVLFNMSAPSYFIRLAIGVLLASGVWLLDVWLHRPLLTPAQALLPPAIATSQAPGSPAKVSTDPGSRLIWVAQGQLPMPQGVPSAHASALLAMPPGHPVALLAFWFAGSRESGPDVQIVMSALSRSSGQWGAAQFVVNREHVAQQLGQGFRRLGNPVPWRDAAGRVHLFVVATGLGGWAASRILHLRQSRPLGGNEAVQFEPVRVLPLSWLWNTSHLVRTAPLNLEDGGMVLPVYFELGKKYPLALRFDAEGGFLGMVQMSQRGHVLQPTLLARSATDWLALMRDNSHDGKIAVLQTLDGGQSWVDRPDLALNNPGASVAALTLAPNHHVLAHNSQPHDRTVLDLSDSQDGLNWRLLHTLARGSGRDEYSYPALAWVDGSLWVSYTDQRQHIAWQRFAFRPEAAFEAARN